MMDLISMEAAATGGTALEADLSESFSPRQVQLVRRFTALVQQSSPNLLHAVEVLVAAVLEDRSNAQR